MPNEQDGVLNVGDIVRIDKIGYLPIKTTIIKHIRNDIYRINHNLEKSIWVRSVGFISQKTKIKIVRRKWITLLKKKRDMEVSQLQKGKKGQNIFWE